MNPLAVRVLEELSLLKITSLFSVYFMFMLSRVLVAWQVLSRVLVHRKVLSRVLVDRQMLSKVLVNMQVLSRVLCCAGVQASMPGET